MNKENLNFDLVSGVSHEAKHVSSFLKLGTGSAVKYCSVKDNLVNRIGYTRVL